MDLFSDYNSYFQPFVDLTFLGSISDTLYNVDMVLGFIFTFICIFWLIYVIFNLFSALKKKKKISLYSMYSDYYQEHLYLTNEHILRWVIIIIFLSFELIFCLVMNSYGLEYWFYNATTVRIPIGSNCSLSSDTHLGIVHDYRLYGIILSTMHLLGDYAFSMIIWLFGASILHLSFAARNELRVKTVIRFILFGIVMNLIVVVFAFSTSLIGNIALSLMNQISFFMVLYIAKKKFFPAMNSRVIDAFHLNNTSVYLQQKRLLKQYKFLVPFFLTTFEIYVIKDVFFYNSFLVIDSICNNPCWFHVEYKIPHFTLPDATISILTTISYYALILVHFADLIIYFNFIVVNSTFLFFLTRNYLKSKFKKQRFRYHVNSAPLLADKMQVLLVL